LKNVIVIIPARMKSTRLPGKPLKIINNKPLIYWTWKNCSKAISATKIFVATDSKKILKVCNQYGIQSIITSSNCLTGTDRVAEAISKFSNKIIINVQGDEPYINYMDIKKFISFSIKNKNSVTNAYTNLFNKKLFENKNIPKVILKKNNDLLYMSRSSIPGSKKKISQTNKQICMYGFPKKILVNLFGKNKKKTPLEKIEDIEILRFIENNIPVKMIKVGDNKLSIDTKFDLKMARMLNKN
jgi:3-deoxy-manno-octulosonate cytidylyltransferase (CMP-KDO synthetase)|tara:strand:- start:25 stop:750 length:726 start_codon:yes stop_codon:yes gene_type:complete